MTKRELVKEFAYEWPNPVMLLGAVCMATGFLIATIFGTGEPSTANGVSSLFALGTIFVMTAYVLLLAKMTKPVARLQTWYEERKATKGE